jgi:16S rRNA A1518/A1519 N6-dimethyltransferase RsmA/KsgA/DIM1 with predicted DNA glycosylase/AP lyase activity
MPDNAPFRFVRSTLFASPNEINCMSSISPKKSLGQHFLTDGNIIRKIADAVICAPGDRVIEIGPGTGALTGELLRQYPALEVIEIDSRAVQVLREQWPGLSIHQTDVLKVSWKGLAGGDGSASGSRVSGAFRGKESDTLNAVDSGFGNNRVDGDGSRSGVEIEMGSTAEVDANSGADTDSAGTGLTAADGLTSSVDVSQSGALAGRISLVGNLPYYITSPILFSVLDERDQFSQAVFMMQKEVAERLVAKSAYQGVRYSECANPAVVAP